METNGDTSNFKVLTGLDHIRERSGMYIGSNENPTHLLMEIVDNALDEVLNDYATGMSILIKDDLEVTISDNGRGMVQGLYNDQDSDLHGREIVDLIYTELFSSEKFGGSTVYKKSVGLHGVGSVVVNALSDYITCQVFQDGKCATYRFVKGEFVGKTEVALKSHLKKNTGTVVTFKPSATCFENMTYDLKLLDQRLKIFHYFYRRKETFKVGKTKQVVEKKADILINNTRVETSSLADIHKSFDSKLPIVEVHGENFHFAMTYDLESSSHYRYGYVNLLPVNDGSHINHMNQIVRNVWSDLRGSQYVFERDDCFVGSAMIFSCYLTNPHFDSQTKQRLTSPKADVKEAVEDLQAALHKALSKEDTFSKFTKPLLMRFHEYRQSMKKLEAIDYVKEAITYGDVKSESNGGVRVSRKSSIKSLVECTSSDREETELYIVEGDSAGGSLISCRNPRIHAVLGLRGKPMNTTNFKLEKVVKNPEFQALIHTIGSGIAPLEQIECVRYGKIIIAADADADGKNIEAILLGGFLRLFPDLVASGRIYVCEAPLYYQGNKYFWDSDKIDLSKPLQRFKGLGEMNSDQIFESMVDDKKRRLVQIAVADDKDKDYALKLVGSTYHRKAMLNSKGVLDNIDESDSFFRENDLTE
jgi:DNA gyrase/topoisomerase IV subunit B